MTRKKETEGYRRCARCKQLKTLDNFCKNKSSHDGLHYYCRDCASLFRAETYWKDPEYSRKKIRQWNKEHPRIYTPESHARLLESKRKYKKTPKGRLSDITAMAKRRSSKSNNGGNFTKEEWVSLCNKYGNKCLACGAYGKMTIDHVKPLSRGGTNSIDNIQPLCLTCNSSKHDKEIDYRY